MTRKERMRAFNMRLDGATWSQIDAALGYETGATHIDMKNVLFGRFRNPNIVYPVLKRWVMRHCEGSIFQLHKLSGISKMRLYDICAGKRAPTPEDMKLLKRITKISAEKLFHI